MVVMRLRCCQGFAALETGVNMRCLCEDFTALETGVVTLRSLQDGGWVDEC